MAQEEQRQWQSQENQDAAPGSQGYAVMEVTQEEEPDPGSDPNTKVEKLGDPE